MTAAVNATGVLRIRDREVIYMPYEYGSRLSIEKDWDGIAGALFLEKYWWITIPISLVYVFVIFSIQHLMRDRKPFDLKSPLIAWNAMLAIFSIVGTIRSGEEFLFAVTTHPLQDSICHTLDITGPVGFWAYSFGWSKVVELGDTIFLVLRKRPLIFLHWYHHIAVMIYTLHALMQCTAGGRWFIFMNFFVHSIMYSYYALSAWGIRFPKGLSMTITTLQTMQMFVGMAISVAVLGVKLSGRFCEQSYENLALCFFIYATFAALFINFFRNAYFRKSKSKQQ